MIFCAVLSHSVVSNSFVTPRPIACQAPLCMGILEVRVPKGIAIPFSRIFPTQGSNPGLLLCRHILYQLSQQGSPRILEWVAYPFSNGSSQPRNRTGVSTLQADSLLSAPQGKSKNTGVGSLSVRQQIFLTQGSNQGLLHCRRIPYCLNHQESC